LSTTTIIAILLLTGQGQLQLQLVIAHRDSQVTLWAPTHACMISGVASYGALGHVPPLDFQIWEPTIQVLCSLRVRDQLVQMSTIHSSFDQYRPTAYSQNYYSSSSCCTRPWSPPWVHHDIISIFAPPRNKSWRRHYVWSHLASRMYVHTAALVAGCYLTSYSVSP